jgi:hypothetical protein
VSKFSYFNFDYNITSKLKIENKYIKNTITIILIKMNINCIAYIKSVYILNNIQWDIDNITEFNNDTFLAKNIIFSYQKKYNELIKQKYGNDIRNKIFNPVLFGEEELDDYDSIIYVDKHEYIYNLSRFNNKIKISFNEIVCEIIDKYNYLFGYKINKYMLGSTEWLINVDNTNDLEIVNTIIKRYESIGDKQTIYNHIKNKLFESYVDQSNVDNIIYIDKHLNLYKLMRVVLQKKTIEEIIFEIENN